GWCLVSPPAQTHHSDRRGCSEAALPVENYRGDGTAVQGDAAPVLKRSTAKRQKTLAVARQSADRHLVDDGGAARGQPNHIAVLDDQRLRNLALLSQAGVGDQMAGFAMDRDRHPRAHHLVHPHELVARRMAGDVDEVILLGDDLDPEPDQRVLQSIYRLLVAGNDARREDPNMARLEHDVGMILAGDPGECRARLAL